MYHASQLFPHDYPEALRLLYDRINYEKGGPTAYTIQNYRLDRMRALLERSGSPHLRYPIIHVAGTKGKGTTATLIYDALRTNSLRVGLYTSPHLMKLEERFQFDGSQCSEAQLLELTREVLEVAIDLETTGLGQATFFELTTAMGMVHFAKLRADCVVLEVGLGGRLDSTNVCQPIISVITSISLDHQTQLGNTIAAIAEEKAGIIKRGVPVVSTARHPDARRVLERVAGEMSAELLLLERDFSVGWQKLKAPTFSSKPDTNVLPVAQVRYSDLSSRWPNTPLAHSTWETRLLGRHHADNLAGAVTVCNWLVGRCGWKLDQVRTSAAIAASHAPARLEIIGRDPIQIIDTAHNPVSIVAGLSALSDHFGQLPRVLVFASSRDKDYREMLQHLLPRCQRLICTAFQNNPRAVAPAVLFEVAQQCARDLDQEFPVSATVEVAESSAEAWQRALQVCPKDGLVVALGSFFLAAELMIYRQSRGET